LVRRYLRGRYRHEHHALDGHFHLNRHRHFDAHRNFDRDLFGAHFDSGPRFGEQRKLNGAVEREQESQQAK